jgi:hypothetical protein
LCRGFPNGLQREVRLRLAQDVLVEVMEVETLHGGNYKAFVARGQDRVSATEHRRTGEAGKANRLKIFLLFLC